MSVRVILSISFPWKVVSSLSYSVRLLRCCICCCICILVLYRCQASPLCSCKECQLYLLGPVAGLVCLGFDLWCWFSMIFARHDCTAVDVPWFLLPRTPSLVRGCTVRKEKIVSSSCKYELYVEKYLILVKCTHSQLMLLKIQIFCPMHTIG